MNKNDCGYILRWSKKIRAINLLGGTCSRCGNNDIFSLNFHHLRDKNKDKGMNALFGGRWSDIEVEIKKCILLCGNCHMEEHMIKVSSEYSLCKTKLLEIKGVDRCQKCGYKGVNNSSLDFHHREGEKKDFTMGNAYRFITSMIEKVEKEIKKCDLLCRNCHAKEHFDFSRFDSKKDEIFKKGESYIELKKIDENEIIKLNNEGLTNKKICEKMNLSASTVSTILSRMDIECVKVVREGYRKVVEEGEEIIEFIPIKKICKSCKKEFLCKNNYEVEKRIYCCQKCKSLGDRKLSIEKEDLEMLLKTESYSELARRYSVVPNTIKNLAKRYSLI